MTDAPVDLDELERGATQWERGEILASGVVSPTLLRMIARELRAARAPREAGVVTREHRRVAAALVRESDGNPSLAAWVSDGDVNEGNWWICDSCVMDAAQAIADAEARGAARAVSQEASELRAEVLTQVQAAMLTDAMRYPENGALHCRWCDGGIRDGHDGRCWYAEQCRRVDVAKALVDTLRKAPTPPADEVAGLLSGVALVREVMSRPGEWTAASYRVAVGALNRLENHLKGER